MNTLKESLQIRKGATREKDPARAAEALYQALWQPDISFAVFYCSPEFDLAALGSEIRRRFGDANIVGCTTAGEITPEGYLHGSLTGVSIASPEFVAVTERIDRLDQFRIADGEPVVKSLINRLERSGKRATKDRVFAFLLVDGLSNREEYLVSSLYGNLGGVSLFGGSAGDEARFEKTFVYHKGAFHGNAAVLTLVHTTYPFIVFKMEHFVPSKKKMVITRADPKRRIVQEINGESAAVEYARLVGVRAEDLTAMTFSAFPVVVKVGGKHFVRAIQKLNPDKSLTFFCAIDEGVVLTLAQGVDILENLKSRFQEIRRRIGPPALVLGCDCILRHLELDQKRIKDKASQIMTENNVIGFSTYGEQYNAMHISQTFTGVAIGPQPSSPEKVRDGDDTRR